MDKKPEPEVLSVIPTIRKCVSCRNWNPHAILDIDLIMYVIYACYRDMLALTMFILHGGPKYAIPVRLSSVKNLLY